MRRTRSRFATLWEFTAFVAVLLVLFLVVVDMAVSRGDEHALRTTAEKTAAAIAGVDSASGTSADDCAPIGLHAAGISDGSSLPARSVCLVKLGVSSARSDARVRIERSEGGVTVCAMMQPRSATGILSPIQDRRTLRTVATHEIEDTHVADGVDPSWAASERALPGSDWDFCPAGRSANSGS